MTRGLTIGTGFALAMLAGAMLLALHAPVRAAEEIVSFQSVIQVNPDASLTVTETITVRAEGIRIKRGIFRDFPTRYFEDSGYLRKVGFTILGIKRDGKAEPYFTKNISRGVRIYIGKKDVFLDHGIHTFELQYRTTRQLRHFEEYDELYWNVTGNRWAFPINRARARVILPPGAKIRQKAGYTGYFGGSGKDYRVSGETDREISFETTRPLRVYEGLTIAVGWQKGLVREPGRWERLSLLVIDNSGVFVLAGGAVLTVLYFLFSWSLFGRDPERGVVIPLFAPPEGFSPAAVSYLHFMGFARAGRGATKAFVAALTSLATKGHLTIEDDDDELTLIATGKDRRGLPAGERAIAKGLLGSRKKITFTRKHGRVIATTQSNFESAIKGEYGQAFFRNNYVRYGIGAAIGILSLILFLPLQQPSEKQIIIYAETLLSGLSGALLLALGGRRLLGWIPGGGSKLLGGLFTLLGLVAIVPALLMPAAAVGTLPVYVPLAILAIAVSLVAFFFLLRAPTVVGRRIMDQIEGFKLYLTVAESERLNLVGAPDLDATLYERYLPYAIGLGVEEPWSEAFAAHLARSAPEAEYSYQPAWYHGRAWDSGRMGTAAGAMVAAVGASMASAMPTSSSSSGSSGGGFSGGGGGGGGGGGW